MALEDGQVKNDSVFNLGDSGSHCEGEDDYIEKQMDKTWCKILGKA